MSQTPAVSSAPLAPIRPRRRRAALLAALTFVIGLFLGAGLAIGVGKHIIHDRMRHPEKIPEHIFKRVKSELNLSPEQTTKVGEIIKLHFDQIRKIHDDGQPQVQEQFDQLEREVDAVLTDQQRPIWHRHLERLRNMGPPPFGPPGPRPPAPPHP
jgi:hypothetical protein